MNYVAILPLRGGSKSIPLKNIKDIAGAPLYAWALKAALESNIFSQIIVSTDSLAIRQDVEARFPAVEIIERKQELATDTASSDAVLLDLVKGKKFKSSDIICLIQATSPLTKPEDFRAARTKFELEQADSLVTGVRWKRFFGMTMQFLLIIYPKKDRVVRNLMVGSWKTAHFTSQELDVCFRRGIVSQEKFALSRCTMIRHSNWTSHPTGF